MAAWLSFRAEDETEDEAYCWRYDSTWEEEEEENEEEDGGSGESGQPEGTEAAAGEEPEDAGEQPMSSWARGAQQAQVGAGAT